MNAHGGKPWQPAQTVLVLQGGGALGAYQAGVYEGLHEAGIEPDWIVGTSIGGINGSIIAGNTPENRVARLRDFWTSVCHSPGWSFDALGGAFAGAFVNFNTVL